MIEYTGDIHGDMTRIFNHVNSLRCKDEEVPDTIVILGDVGANFYLDGRDWNFKRKLNKLEVNFLCIHGNHECRPQRIPSYHLDEFMGGKVLVEDEYPNLKFAIDGEIFDLEGRNSIVIGGAYSVDKFYRLENGWPWWDDEQPSEKVKERVEENLGYLDWKINQVLSHTCPISSRPKDVLDPGVDQSRVDNSTEIWLDSIEKSLDYDRWLCGHYHIDRQVGKIRFVMEDFVSN